MVPLIKSTIGSLLSTPKPNPYRKVNPFIAFILELFGLIGVLGLGRIYAGDPNGMNVLLNWIKTVLILIFFSGIGFVIALVGSFVTFGGTLIVFSIGVGFISIAVMWVTVSSAISLFIGIQRL